MSKKNKKKSAPARSKRFSLPEEADAPWLKILLDAYYVIDRGVASSIAAQQMKGRTLACRRGCSSCCSTHKDIPVYPLELKGIVWYVTEKITDPARGVLKTRLHNFKKDSSCPFLIENACSIHPIRPMACRQFNVFGNPCTEGEDPYYTRREDVMDPVTKHVDQAFFIMLPFHGIEKDSERRRIIEAGGMHRMVRDLHSCNWTALAERMENTGGKGTEELRSKERK